MELFPQLAILDSSSQCNFTQNKEAYKAVAVPLLKDFFSFSSFLFHKGPHKPLQIRATFR